MKRQTVIFDYFDQFTEAIIADLKITSATDFAVVILKIKSNCDLAKLNPKS